MKSRIFTAGLALAGSLLVLGAMTVPAAARADLDVVIGAPPPPPRVEVVPAPRPGFLWAPGYWEWEGRHHIWRRGHWEHVHPGGEFYEQAHWVETPGGWHFIPGHWAHR